MPQPAAPPALPLTFDVPARHRFRRGAVGGAYAALAVAWLVVVVLLVEPGTHIDPLTLLPPLGLAVLSVGALLVLPRLRQAPVASLRVEPARLVTEGPRGLHRFPAHRVRAGLVRDHGDLVLTLDVDERPRPPEPVRVVIGRYGEHDPRLSMLAGVLAASGEAETRQVVAALLPPVEPPSARAADSLVR